MQLSVSAVHKLQDEDIPRFNVVSRGEKYQSKDTLTAQLSPLKSYESNKVNIWPRKTDFQCV